MWNYTISSSYHWHCNAAVLLVLSISFSVPRTGTSFDIKNVFGGSSISLPFSGNANANANAAIQTARNELLETISNTQNGKEASLSTQIKVLGLVDYLETKARVSETLLTDPSQAEAIDGLWYLQYTQPSEPEGVDLENDIVPWKPSQSSLEYTKKLDTRKANNEGSVSFLGVVKVDTSNKVTTQTIGVKEKLFANAVQQDFGTIRVEGTFELDSVPNRIIAAFDKGTLSLNEGPVLDFSFLFALRALFKGGLKAGGWLETTYLDESVRIGRGNRGSLFVLTRDQTDVEA